MEPSNTLSSPTALLATPLAPTKFRDPLRIPPVIRPPHHPEHLLTIELLARSLKFHSEMPASRVWTYAGSVPGPTIEVRRGQRLRVAYHNLLSGPFPVTAVQATLPPFTPGPGRDGVAPRADIAALPPWTVTHLHGARTGAGNDGWTENAVLPGASQLAEYLNDQPAAGLWYHDHAMAITAFNVMTGLAGMYLIRDDEEDALDLPCGEFELPLMVCDRNFDLDAAGNLTGQLLHKVQITAQTPDVVTAPPLMPYTLVNGVLWPHKRVHPRWYRLRLVNASNLRFYRFALQDEAGQTIPGALRLIGTDSGLLGAPATLDQLTLAPAERADVLVDFGAFAGQAVRLVNLLAPPLLPGTTTPNPDVMEFRVRSGPGHDHFTPPSTLSPTFHRLTHANLPPHEHRWLVLTLVNAAHPELWEMEQIETPASLPPGGVDGIVQFRQADGQVITLQRISRDFKDAANFYVEHDGWEQWKILNISPVRFIHPIHIHLIRFQALSRDRYDVTTGVDAITGSTTAPVPFIGSGAPGPDEQGFKDVIRVGGGELVSVAGQFGGGTGRYMYHCHILEHEDEGMMRTFVVTPKEVMDVDPHMHEGGHSH